MPEYGTFGKRLEKLRHSLEMNNKELMSELNIGNSTFYNWMARDEAPPLAVIKITAAFPKVSKEWLLTGEGEMFLSKQPQEKKTAAFNDEDDGHGGLGQMILSLHRRIIQTESTLGNTIQELNNRIDHLDTELKEAKRQLANKNNNDRATFSPTLLVA